MTIWDITKVRKKKNQLLLNKLKGENKSSFKIDNNTP